MDAFGNERREIAATLEAGGVDKVSLDPRGQPPMVLVDAPSLIDTTNAGATWQVTIPVKVIAPPPGDAAALDWLLSTLEAVLIALGDGTSARSGTTSVNEKDLPSYAIDVVRTLVTPCE